MHVMLKNWQDSSNSCLAVELARRTDNCSFIPPDITYKVLIFSSNLSMNSLKE